MIDEKRLRTTFIRELPPRRERLDVSILDAGASPSGISRPNRQRYRVSLTIGCDFTVNPIHPQAKDIAQDEAVQGLRRALYGEINHRLNDALRIGIKDDEISHDGALKEILHGLIEMTNPRTNKYKSTNGFTDA